MAIVALIGPPGCGKTTMACLTAPRKPVHVVDIDRKIRAMANLAPAIKKGELTFKEIGETLTEESLSKRLDELTKNEKMARAPKGWLNFANYMGTLESDPVVKNAGTLVVDTYTQLKLHMRVHIQYLMGRGKLEWDDWTAWLSMWNELSTILTDYALANDKDLIVNLHERVSEKPGPQTKKVTVKVSEKGVRSKEYVGTMDVKVAASIEGQFGLEFGTHFTDVYALRVDVDREGKPTWKCRVHPDGQRDLRCSFDTDGVSEFEPNFGKIWRR